MKKKFFASLLLAFAALPNAWSADYGIPAGIQEGNILHCFNWTMAQVKEELPTIAAAGFGSVQLSPLQRGDVNVGSPWHDLYRPYDLAFKSSGMGSEADLKSLCQEAEKYGIKVIVDVVANHVDKTAGYHDTWWDASGRVRWNGGINYGDRYSITHGQLGDYGDVNSEDAQVIARAKAYVQTLAGCGVKGIRWDAAKHIGLPSEGCNFWSEVTSVPGVWHYGEILDAPGPNAGIIKEYANYMSVTDNKYSNGAARDNGGIPFGYGGDWVVNQSLPDTKLVYWGESHDTYSNDEWSCNVDQSVIDRAYCAFASRNGATALYLARPNARGFSNIKVGKGSTAFKAKHIAEVNKFRNAMTGKKDWFETNGNACSVTRQNGGAVIVMKGSGNVSVANGGGYCPAGTYTDRVSGGTFTVTASTISGNVGASGVAVIYNDGDNPNPNPDPDPDPQPGDFTIYYDNSVTSWSNVNIHYWSAPNTEWPGVAMTKVEGNIWKYTFPSDPSGLKGFLFCDGSGSGDNNQTADVNGAPVNKHLYKGAGGSKGAVTDQGVYQGNNPNPDPDPDPDPDPTPQPGGSYYQVNPNGQFGANRTVSTTGHPASNALSNWKATDLIAQGVARDVAQAIKGFHERPIIDSYAVYAAYDAQNLYLGVQYVYTIWDLYGEGKQPGESKPYNMDGRLMIVFDLDPNKSVDGTLVDGNTVWDSDGQYNLFNNGADAFFLASTKPGVGTPGFFKPNANGKLDYKDPASNISNHGIKYGYADGLLPSIKNIWGQKEFGFDPELLKGETGFVDLMSEIATSAHTFYEYTFPLSTLGVTESYIKDNGIGVLIVDTYGQGAIGSTPYDPTCFDHVKDNYSKDPSSSAEKEDKDIFTCGFARIGKVNSSAVSTIEAAAAPEVLGLDGELRVNGLDGQSVMVAGADGKLYYTGTPSSALSLPLTAGVYLVNISGQTTRVLVR